MLGRPILDEREEPAGASVRTPVHGEGGGTQARWLVAADGRQGEQEIALALRTADREPEARSHAAVDVAGDQPDLPADARDILGQVGAFALTLPSRENQIEFHAVLTINDAAGPN